MNKALTPTNSLDKQAHQEKQNDKGNETDFSNCIPRLPLPDCMKNAKSDLYNLTSQKGVTPSFSSESDGDAHALRWRCTLTFDHSSSKVSVSPLFKTKKDAEKAAAYRAVKYDINKLVNESHEIKADLQDDIMWMKACHEEEGKVWEELVANSYTNAPPSKHPNISSSAVEAAHLYREILDPSTDQSVSRSSTISLPFSFPISSEDLPDCFQAYCSKCMRSETRQRFVFAFGTYGRWRNGWLQSLQQCIENRGVVICATQEAFEDVAKAFQEVPDLRKECNLSREEKEIPPNPRSCVLLSSVLECIDLNPLFPTERPLLIIDNSDGWSTTWKWLTFCPTFHIVSYCWFDSVNSSPLIRLGTLRDVYNCDLITHMYIVCLTGNLRNVEIPNIDVVKCNKQIQIRS